MSSTTALLPLPSLNALTLTCYGSYIEESLDMPASVLKEIHLDFTFPSHTDVLDASRNDVQLFGEKTFIL